MYLEDFPLYSQSNVTYIKAHDCYGILLDYKCFSYLFYCSFVTDSVLFNTNIAWFCFYKHQLIYHFTIPLFSTFLCVYYFTVSFVHSTQRDLVSQTESFHLLIGYLNISSSTFIFGCLNLLISSYLSLNYFTISCLSLTEWIFLEPFFPLDLKYYIHISFQAHIHEFIFPAII